MCNILVDPQFVFFFLFLVIADEQYLYKCPDRLRLPLIFYLAHPATLYVNKLLLASLLSVGHAHCVWELNIILLNIVSIALYVSMQKRINSKFEAMFETGVNELSWDDTVSIDPTSSS